MIDDHEGVSKCVLQEEHHWNMRGPQNPYHHVTLAYTYPATSPNVSSYHPHVVPKIFFGSMLQSHDKEWLVA